MKILVLSTDYPDLDGNVKLMYVHTRNKFYLDQGIDVTVLNFSAKLSYSIDGIKVISETDYLNSQENFDILISHAPNIRNHYKFIKKFGKNFKNIIFFYHGHEVLKINKIYPKAYDYLPEGNIFSRKLRDMYDVFKLKVWKRYILKNITKLNLVFVSEWMYNQFVENIDLDKEEEKIVKDKSKIIYNSIGSLFEEKKFNFEEEKTYDFITIRNNLDGSKYSIDVVRKLAIKNPNYKFCVVGKGKFFDHYSKPDNLILIDKNLDHQEIIEYLNKSKIALLPTRTDAQGVMACEMASFGIPLITSNISVCQEIFDGFNNVKLIPNDEPLVLDNIYNVLTKKQFEKNGKFYAKKTISMEIELFEEVVGNE